MMRVGLRFRKLQSFQDAQKLIKRYMKAQTQAVTDNQMKDINDEAFVRPYEEIPGPKPLPLIGNSFRFLPYIGNLSNFTNDLISQMESLKNTYGEIVKLDEVYNRRPTIFLFNADYVERVYRSQSIWPLRLGLDSLHHYRLNRKEYFGDIIGLTTSQGKQWHNMRTKVNPAMMHPQAIKPHVRQVDAVAVDFVEKMKKLRDPKTLELPDTINNEMNKWTLESTCLIALGQRLGCLEFDLSNDSDPQKMIDSIHEMFHLMYRLEILPSFWKAYDTRNLKKMFKTLDTLYEISAKYINITKENILKKQPNETEEHEESVLEKLLHIDEQIAFVMALDMLTAGVDTTSNAAGVVLYNIATNPKCQKKLREEVERVLPTKSAPITYDTVNNIPYLRACVKEALRLMPITIGNLRSMEKDVVIGGYKIPKHSDVIACHSQMGLDPAYFPESKKFIPERWIRDSPEYLLTKAAHPFAYLAFGFGARSCIGKRFAELEVETLVLRMMQNFKIEWHHGPLRQKSHFINAIETPLKFKLIDI